MPPAAIIGGGAAVAGVSSIGAALIGKGAAGDAAAAQTDAIRQSAAAQTANTDKAINFLGQQATQSRQDLQPFRDAQVGALGQLQSFTDPNSAFYQQQRDYATQAIQRQLAAQGLLRSSAQGGQLQQLELGLGQQRLNILGGLAGNGAAQGMSSISQGLGQNVAGLYGGLGQSLGSSFQAGGQAQAQGIMGMAQATMGGLNGFGNTIQGTAGNIYSMNMLAQMMAQRQVPQGPQVDNYNAWNPIVPSAGSPGPWALQRV